MNILTDALPSTVEICGRKYPINTDFRAGVEFECSTLHTEEDIYRILTVYFGDKFPEDIRGAIEAISKFYACGETPSQEKKRNTKQAYSFEVDSSIIFADFWHYYNIDLSQEGLHWWVFRALLLGLPENSEFKQRTYYRTCDTKGMSKKEKERIMKIRKRIEIKGKEVKLSLEERNAQMKAYVSRRQNEIKKGG